MFEAAGAWSNNWAWSLPLIVFTVLAHTFGLALIREQVVLPLSVRLRPPSDLIPARRPHGPLVVMLVTFLHAIEAGAWAVAYVALGARADFASPPCSIR